jgi:hypothetical protein
MPDKRMDGFFKLWEDAQSVKDAEEELADAEARLRNPRAPGWLYAVGPAEQMRLWDWGVEDWGPPVLRVKIGVSKHELAPQGRRGRRLSELQCGSPVALGVYDEVRVPDMQKAEEEVHALLKHARLHGEWFDATDDGPLVASMAPVHRITSQGPRPRRVLGARSGGRGGPRQTSQGPLRPAERAGPCSRHHAVNCV